jgi:hypothetical protein
MTNNLFVRYLLAVVTTYVVAVVFVSQFNASSIVALGVSVGLWDRLLAVWHDLIGMAELYLPIIAIALLIAFVFTKQVLLRFLENRGLLYSLAGFVGIATVHLTLKAVFDVSAIAPTATVLGLLSQCIAGAFGGWVFYRLGKDKHG